jgi:hypothetical protein
MELPFGGGLWTFGLVVEEAHDVFLTDLRSRTPAIVKKAGAQKTKRSAQSRITHPA